MARATGLQGALFEPVQGVLGDFLPAVVDSKRVAAVLELLEVRDRRRLVVELPGRGSDRGGHRVVLAAGYQQQWLEQPVDVTRTKRPLRAAREASNNGLPGDGTAQRS